MKTNSWLEPWHPWEDNLATSSAIPAGHAAHRSCPTAVGTQEVPLCLCHPSCLPGLSSTELQELQSPPSKGATSSSTSSAFNLTEKPQQKAESGFPAFLAGNGEDATPQKPLAFLHPGPGIHPDLLADAQGKAHVLFSPLDLLKHYFLSSPSFPPSCFFLFFFDTA